MESNRDFMRIKTAIEFIEANLAAQPDLDRIAAHVGLSPFHLQRLFGAWAGTSPKRFLDYLTVARAKPLLQDRHSILATSWQVGLSGAGRLHDHFVALEGVSPGQYKARGAGLRIAWGLHDTPFGDMLLAATERGICWLAFVADVGAEAELQRLCASWPGAEFVADAVTTAPLAAQVFAHPRVSTAPLHLDVRGTNFQVSVWRALLNIPSGAVATYRAIADYLGKPTASRAVATAIAHNPVGYLIPCHRVIRASGALAGFRWGVPMKRLMLAREVLQYGNASDAAPDMESGTF
jgi:AraC family transcriptional regulator of adaptative response/methylated-DNA-[protein]-cysteine methyltransferase